MKQKDVSPGVLKAPIDKAQALTFPPFCNILNASRMNDNIIFVPSTFRHGYTQNDIEWAIETKIYEGLLSGEDEIYAVIGFNVAGNPI